MRRTKRYDDAGVRRVNYIEASLCPICATKSCCVNEGAARGGGGATEHATDGDGEGSARRRRTGASENLTSVFHLVRASPTARSPVYLRPQDVDALDCAVAEARAAKVGDAALQV